MALPSADVKAGRALPLRGPGQSQEGWLLGLGALRGETLPITAALAFLPAPSLIAPARAEAAAVGRFPLPDRGRPPPSPPHPPRRVSPGSALPEKAAPKIRKGAQEGPESSSVFFLWQPGPAPCLPSSEGHKGPWNVLSWSLGSSLAPPFPPKPRWQRRQIFSEQKP